MEKTVRKRSQKQEKGVAKDLDAKVVVASGAIWSAKGDCRSEKCLIECKTTLKDYYSVTAKVWEKIEEEALRDGMRVPLLIVDIKDKDRYVVFDPNYFEEVYLNNYECTYKGEPKSSFRVSPEFLDKCEEVYGDHITGSLEYLKGHKKNHALLYARFDDFVKTYKEEL